MDRAAKYNGAGDLKCQAEDKITAADCKKYESALRKKLRIAP